MRTGFLFFCSTTLALLSIYYRSMSTPASILPEGAVWADHPLPLVETPVNLTGKTDMFTTGASHMALLHNVILRGFNSIYLQAPAVKPSDVPDFLGYSLAWCRFVKAHHDDEEAELFPKLEAIVGVPGVLSAAIDEHRLFEEGLTAMNDYLLALPTPPTTFSGPTLVSIMDTFLTPFGTHFGAQGEIAHIAALASKFPDDPALRPVFATWGKNSLMKTGVLDGVPFMFANLDRGVEGGRWSEWPRIPGPIKWGMINLGGAWHAGWWRFGSTDAQGQRRVLEAFKG